jgi:2-phospho-L-lactate guanylyltransferase
MNASDSPDPQPHHDSRYAVLVPVKRPAVAKSRLGELGDRLRTDLATAFAADTVAAALACDLVRRVLVVTDDHALARGLSDMGADVIPDGASDLNGTLVQAAAEMHRRDPGLCLAAVCADLPALRPVELGRALRAADPGRMSFVADHDRVGTTAVVAPSLDRFRPAFGSGSRLQHLAAGAHEVDGIDVPTLRRDVDDPDDLTAAIELGVGPRTAMVTTALRLPSPYADRHAGNGVRVRRGEPDGPSAAR